VDVIGRASRFETGAWGKIRATPRYDPSVCGPECRSCANRGGIRLWAMGQVYQTFCSCESLPANCDAILLTTAVSLPSC